MEFCNIIRGLTVQYENNCTVAENGTIFLAPRQPQDKAAPIAKHIVFAPMTEKAMEYLIQSYIPTFPNELLKIYQVANGMNLFQQNRSFICKGKQYYLCNVQLSVYGVPFALPTINRPEPFNISVEDLSRLPGTPANFLKFGSYITLQEQSVIGEFDTFVDVECGKAYTIPREGTEAVIQETWESVDQCLCDLFWRISSMHQQQKMRL